MFAFGHLIGGWTLGKLFEVFSGMNLTRTAWMILLFGSLLPDVDLLFDGFFKKKHTEHLLIQSSSCFLYL